MSARSSPIVKNQNGNPTPPGCRFWFFALSGFLRCVSENHLPYMISHFSFVIEKKEREQAALPHPETLSLASGPQIAIHQINTLKVLFILNSNDK